MANKKEELKEQAKYITWAKEHGLEPYAIPASTFTDSWKAINENKMAGVVKGLPDTITLIPYKRSTQGRNKLVFIEFKKVTGGRLSKEQIHFIDFVKSIYGDVHAFVAYGFEDAKRQLEPLLNPITDDERNQWLKDNNLI